MSDEHYSEPSTPSAFAELDYSSNRFRGTTEFLAGHRVSSDDGIYAGWKWDGRQLSLESDRYGLHPFFYVIDGQQISLAPRLETLIRGGASTAWDDDAIAVFLRLGCYVGDDTPFRAIRAMPARATLGNGDGRLTIRSHEALPTPTRLSRSQVLEAYIELFRASMRKRVEHEQLALPLSGGRDSRHILFALNELGRPPDVCITARHFPPRGDDDVEVARELCRRLGISHVVVNHPARRLEAELGKNRETHFCSDEHAQMLPVAEWLREHSHAAYDGIGGDVLSAGHFRRPEAVGMVRKRAAHDLATFMVEAYDPTIESALQKALTPEAYRRFSRERAIARVEREVRARLDEADPVASFFFWNRTRREVALSPYALMTSGAPVYAPFLDSELFDLLASLPMELTLDQTLHGDAIAKAYPQFRDIPYEDRSIEKSSRGHFRRWALEMASFFFIEGEQSDWFRPGYVLKSLALTAARGNGESLWFVPRAICLLQLQRLLASMR